MCYLEIVDKHKCYSVNAKNCNRKVNRLTSDNDIIVTMLTSNRPVINSTTSMETWMYIGNILMVIMY